MISAPKESVYESSLEDSDEYGDYDEEEFFEQHIECPSIGLRNW